MDVITLSAALGIPGSVALAAGVVRKFFHFQTRLEETLKPDEHGRSISQQVAAITGVVDEIKTQVYPNGGESLRDAVNSAAASAKTASDQAALAAEKAANAADQAGRAEIMGNFERRDIRHKLESIETKIDTAQTVLTTHLVDSAAQTETIKKRLDDVEKNQQRSA